MKYYPLLNESPFEFYQDLSLGICFLLIAFLTIYRTRLYFDPFGQGRVITTFYVLILLTTLVRAVWFLIPSYILEGSYIPEPLDAFQSVKWQGCLVSEVLLISGNIFLFSQFILIISYWSYMIRKAGSSQKQISSQSSRSKNKQIKKEYSLYFVVVTLTTALEIINIALFITQTYNSEIMIVYDSVLMSLLSLFTLISLCYYSYKIRMVMEQIRKINKNPSSNAIMKAQISRIYAITVGAVIFFVCRASIELAFTFSTTTLLYEKKRLIILIDGEYWDYYILLKHGMEVIVLMLELIVSTNINESSQAQNERKRNLGDIGLNSRSNHEHAPLISDKQTKHGSYGTSSHMHAEADGLVSKRAVDSVIIL